MPIESASDPRASFVTDAYLASRHRILGGSCSYSDSAAGAGQRPLFHVHDSEKAGLGLGMSNVVDADESGVLLGFFQQPAMRLTLFGPTSNLLISIYPDTLLDEAMNQPIDDLLLDTELTLDSLEKSDNPVLKRIAERLLDKRPDSVVAGHVSHASSSGRGHSSHVTGRFEDETGAAS
jgi:hypothetical protein